MSSEQLSAGEEPGAPPDETNETENAESSPEAQDIVEDSSDNSEKIATDDVENGQITTDSVPTVVIEHVTDFDESEHAEVNETPAPDDSAQPETIADSEVPETSDDSEPITELNEEQQIITNSVVTADLEEVLNTEDPPVDEKAEITEAQSDVGIETAPLVGAEGGTSGFDEDDVTSDSDQAPPLPEKRPLLSSTEQLSLSITREDSDSSSQSSEEEIRDTDRSGQPLLPIQHATVSVEQGGTPVSLNDVMMGIPAAPNEPPPPYSPHTGGDPYDGTPGDDRIVMDERVVIVQRPAVVGNCPKCQTGNIMKNFSFCGICLAIWLFPCGLVCLFCMREKKCSHCNEKV